VFLAALVAVVVVTQVWAGREPLDRVMTAVMPVAALQTGMAVVVVVPGLAGETVELLAVRSLLAMAAWVVNSIFLEQ
jgi:hypothetical protein